MSLYTDSLRIYATIREEKRARFFGSFAEEIRREFKFLQVSSTWRQRVHRLLPAHALPLPVRIDGQRDYVLPRSGAQVYGGTC